jgi:hypothetical protein
MHDFILLFVHVIVTMARLAGPGGLRSVVAESALLRHQLLILNRGRKRAPNLRTTDRIVAARYDVAPCRSRPADQNRSRRMVRKLDPPEFRQDPGV